MENSRLSALENLIASSLLYGCFGQEVDIGLVEEPDHLLLGDYIGRGHRIEKGGYTTNRL